MTGGDFWIGEGGKKWEREENSQKEMARKQTK
jgi:hypothetical protein